MFMALLGTIVDRTNPPKAIDADGKPTREYTIADLKFWIPSLKNVNAEELQTMYDNLFPIAYNKIFYSVFGSDWYYAMSLCIAHYNYLINTQIPNNIDPSKEISLSEVTGGGVPRGVMTSASIGGFTKSYDYSLTTVSGSAEAMFWNQSAYGMSLMALYKSKSTLTAFVVTDGPLLPGCAPFNQFPSPNANGQDWVDSIINPKKFH